MNRGDKADADPIEGICEMCGNPLRYSGDNWDGLCPSCADKVSAHLDEFCLNDEDRDNAIEALKHSEGSL